MNSIKLVDKKTCTGCSACYNICPKQAISMQQNDEGFLYPVIDEEKCINCGLCLKSCAAHAPKYENSKDPECYAVWAEDKIRLKSASGGAFSIFSEYILEQGGVVCGAAWDENFNVVHAIVDNKDDLDKLRGVKYIQSSTNTCYTQIKNFLTDGKFALFTGTPCQVAGLKAFLGKDYENLLTIDLVCHGAPSPGVWQQYLKEHTFGQKITGIKFRNKRFDWSQSLEIYLDNGIIYRGVPPMDSFYESFFILMNTRKSCGHCAFSRITRQGDLTIGDAWNCQSEMNDHKGTSEILINNEKGRLFFDAAIKKASRVEKFDLEAAKKGNRALTQSFVPHPYRERFFKLIKKHTIKEAYSYAVKNQYDVALLGIWFYQNYGSVLTTFALGRILNYLGKEVLLVDNSSMFAPNARWRNGCLKNHEFLGTFFDIAPCNNKSDLKQLNARVETFIVGSDQLFNWFLSLECGGYTYFLDFVEQYKKKIAYATSFGDGYNFFKKEFVDCKPLLQDFDAISVRENGYIDIINKEFDINAVCNLDPVFLLDTSEYEQLSLKSQQTDVGGIVAYILDMTQEKKDILEYMSQKLGYKITLLTDAEIKSHEYTKTFKVQETKDNIDICDWLKYFKYADYIITDSFHGMCFSIIFRKDFICLFNKQRGVSRFYTILSSLGLIDRGFSDISLIYNVSHIFEKIDYQKVANTLSKWKQSSLEWLQQALCSDKFSSKNSYKNLFNRIVELEKELSGLREEFKNKK